MEKLNKNQIDQFLNITKEVTASADHVEVSNSVNFWDEDATISGLTFTTSLGIKVVGV